MTEPRNELSIFQKRMRSFRYAFEGISYVMRTQPNTRIHLLIMVIVIIVALWLELTLLDWTLLVLAITIVWTAEFTNTAIEALVDLASPEHHRLAKVAKDVSAGAVLVGAIGSVVVGLLVLAPPLLLKIGFGPA
jgi:undecaprenol kinase/diacylglycerol kinase (ATP)